jgi:hypothetical protein
MSAAILDVTLDQQIACVKRELKLRRSVYPALVGNKRMSQLDADIQISHMEAVLKTLERLHGEEQGALFL